VTTPPLGDWLRDDPDVEVVTARPERRAVILRRIDLWSALKLSLALYSCVFAVAFVGGIGVWMAARHMGGLGYIERQVEVYGFADNGTFHLRGMEVLKFSAVVGPILVVLGALATVAAVAVFNGVARLFGGVEVTVADGD
jgi:nitrate reductase NapE component